MSIIIGSLVMLAIVMCTMYKRRRTRTRKARFNDKEEIEMLDKVPDVPNPPLVVGRKFRLRLSSNMSQV